MEADLDGELIQEPGLTKEHLHFFDSLHCSAIKVKSIIALSNHQTEAKADSVCYELQDSKKKSKNSK